MSARLERIARMDPVHRMMAVESFIEGAAHGAGVEFPALEVTYRRSRTGNKQVARFIVIGVATNDNGTSFGELIIRDRPHSPYGIHGISLAHLDALETVE